MVDHKANSCNMPFKLKSQAVLCMCSQANRLKWIQFICGTSDFGGRLNFGPLKITLLRSLIIMYHSHKRCVAELLPTFSACDAAYEPIPKKFEIIEPILCYNNDH